VPHQRERLAAVFWGDHSSHDARKCLRHVLWRLRQALEAAGAQPDQYLALGDDMVCFLPQAPYQLDAEAFEAILSGQQGMGADHLGAEQVEEIEKAVGLYTGDLLQDVDADWCLHDREHFRLLYLNALDKLMIYHGLHGSYECGLACGEQILAFDNTREKIHQRMMWLHWTSGNRCAAVMQYKLCAQILREEMGIGPMKQTQQLLHVIQHSEPASAGRLPVFEQMPAFFHTNSSELSTPVVHELLQRIHHLQAVVEQSSSELRSLEQLVSKALLHSGHS
jgi:DNA-binding SARP family transcriptional activator